MNSVGIIRRIDDLGRIVIPREVRQRMNISDGDELEFFFEGDRIVLTPYFRSFDSRRVIKSAIEFIRESDCLSEEKKSDAIARMNEVIDIIEQG